jgi:hypothetical protein
MEMSTNWHCTCCDDLIMEGSNRSVAAGIITCYAVPLPDRAAALFSFLFLAKKAHSDSTHTTSSVWMFSSLPTLHDLMATARTSSFSRQACVL